MKFWRTRRTRRSGCITDVSPSSKDDIRDDFVFVPSLRCLPSRKNTASSEGTLVDEDFGTSTIGSTCVDDEEDQEWSKPMSCENGRKRKKWKKLPPLSSVLLTSITLGEATDIPYLKGLAAITRVVANTIQSTEDNHQNCLRLIDMVHEIKTTAETLSKKADSAEVQLDAEDNLEELRKVTSRIEERLKHHAKRTYISRLFHSDEITIVMSDCEKDLQQALNKTELRSLIRWSNALRGRSDSEDLLCEEILQMSDSCYCASLEAPETLKSSTSIENLDSSTTVPTSLPSPAVEVSDVSDSLPAPSHIFYGRDRELQRLVDMMTTSKHQAHTVLCGPPGVGKSTLARQMLHHEDVERVFGFLRYFVPCDNIGTLTDLIVAIISSLGVPVGQHGSPLESLLAILVEVERPTRCLLILDNFESVWETLDSRNEVESFLAQLSSLSGVSLLVTVRCTQRPLGPDWTHFPPLCPLDPTSARQAFLAVSDASPEDPDIDRLLHLVDYLPLAITLMAQLAQYHPLNFLIDRYAVEGTPLLRAGSDRTSSMDISLEVSLHGKAIRECPHTLDALRLLAREKRKIPRMSCAGLISQALGIAECSAQKSITLLLQNSLAFQDSDRALYIPSLVRSYLEHH